MKNRRSYLLASLALLGSVTACGTNGQATTVSATVTAGNGSCTTTPEQVRAGHATLDVENTASAPTGVAVYTENDSGHFTHLLGRAPQVQPGGHASIATALPQGQYRIVCTPASGQPDATYLRAVMIAEGGGEARSYDKLFTFQVTPQGQVSTEPDLTVHAGDVVKLELFNRAHAQYKLVVTNSLDQQVAALGAPAQDLGQTNVELDQPGRLKVRVSAAGSTQTFPLTVTK
ncbi:MAG TPA: hypothetical protein VFJ09_01695 [Nocardioidaceae bacterium]|nr:hypothetical protein [Nocardioidaceae bacterium]